jgi:3-oxoacyl-[acyl-carrier protein] reductase
MDLGLENKVAFIAGSSQGLGFAIARQLVLEKAVTVINGRNPTTLKTAYQDLIRLGADQVHQYSGDVTEEQFPLDLFNFLNNNFGKLDILITNSGGPTPGKFESLSNETWYSAFKSNFLSHARLIKTLLPLLRRGDHPNVLTITSSSVKQPIPNLVLSNSIRAATVGLTKTLALELGHEGIRFNSILPGWTKTDRVVELMKNRADTNKTSVEDEIHLQASETPLGRMAEPEEIANVATFMVSPRASYLTGNMLSVDGGSVKGIL